MKFKKLPLNTDFMLKPDLKLPKNLEVLNYYY